MTKNLNEDQQTIEVAKLRAEANRLEAMTANEFNSWYEYFGGGASEYDVDMCFVGVPDDEEAQTKARETFLDTVKMFVLTEPELVKTKGWGFYDIEIECAYRGCETPNVASAEYSDRLETLLNLLLKDFTPYGQSLEYNDEGGNDLLSHTWTISFTDDDWLDLIDSDGVELETRRKQAFADLEKWLTEKGYDMTLLPEYAPLVIVEED